MSISPPYAEAGAIRPVPMIAAVGNETARGRSGGRQATRLANDSRRLSLGAAAFTRPGQEATTLGVRRMRRDARMADRRTPARPEQRATGRPTPPGQVGQARSQDPQLGDEHVAGVAPHPPAQVRAQEVGDAQNARHQLRAVVDEERRRHRHLPDDEHESIGDQERRAAYVASGDEREDDAQDDERREHVRRHDQGEKSQRRHGQSRCELPFPLDRCPGEHAKQDQEHQIRQGLRAEVLLLGPVEEKVAPRGECQADEPATFETGTAGPGSPRSRRRPRRTAGPSRSATTRGA